MRILLSRVFGLWKGGQRKDKGRRAGGCLRAGAGAGRCMRLGTISREQTGHQTESKGMSTQSMVAGRGRAVEEKGGWIACPGL